MRIILRKERPMTQNVFYSGIHWNKRREEAQRVHDLVKAHIKPEYPLFTKKVDISIVAYFDKYPFDSDNIMAKIYIDGLKPRLIQNDSHEYVGFVSTKSEVDKANPRVEILIKECE